MQKKTFPHLEASQRNLSTARRSTPWHAVAVVQGTWSCEAVHALPPIRYLSREAPRLPLPQCSSPAACTCAYKHFVDRRGQPRRKDDMSGLRRAGHLAHERRVTRGRREDD